MKKLNFLIAVVAIIVLAVTANASVTFLDDYTITGVYANVNDQTNRQTGPAAPVNYNQFNGVADITNAGSSAYKMKVTKNASAGAVYISLQHDFTESSNFSVEYDLTRLHGTTTKEDDISIGADTLGGHSSSDGAVDIKFYENGQYKVYEPGGTEVFNDTFSELDTATAPTLHIKIVVKADDFLGSDAQIFLFINGKPYPLVNTGGYSKYRLLVSGGFSNNYISLWGNQTTFDIDNFQVNAIDDVADILTNAWTGDVDSGILDLKTYTHTINFGGNSITINDQLFTGSGTAKTGSDWALTRARDNDNSLSSPIASVPNISGSSSVLASNFFWSGNNNIDTALSFSGLISGKDYILTLYGLGSPVARTAYIATLDGRIKLIDMNWAGNNNGFLLTHQYTAPDNGIFSISVSQVERSWYWYAFSNEQAIPEPAFIGFILLGAFALLKRKF